LKGATQTNTSEYARLEQIHVRLGPFRLLEVDLGLDFLKFELHKLRILISFTVEIR
jgi:hypothetical protein